jgi:hypothetical protein
MRLEQGSLLSKFGNSTDFPAKKGIMLCNVLLLAYYIIDMSRLPDKHTNEIVKTLFM